MEQRWIETYTFPIWLKALKNNNRVGGDIENGGNELQVYFKKREPNSHTKSKSIKVTLFIHHGQSNYLFFTNDERKRIIKIMEESLGPRNL
jgi:hypothetical protein